MARRATLSLAVLAGLVLLAHLLVLGWLATLRQPAANLREMPPALYTRLLRPQAPPAVAPAARAEKPATPRTARGAIAPSPQPAASAPEPSTGQQQVTSEPAAPPAEAASATAAPPTSPAPPPSAWPPDTRLTYRLGGRFRSGPLFGEARVKWQRVDDLYQARLELEVKYFGGITMTSQGEVTPQGLLPRTYEEFQPGLRRWARFDDHTLLLEKGRRAPRPPGLQDSVSQFVELSWRFATGREALEVGRVVRFPMARPEGVDDWTYDVVERQLLHLPALGPVEAFHLKPRPLANPRGNITAEMWFAPGLQHLPVRIVVRMGDEVELDLLVETIEQQ